VSSQLGNVLQSSVGDADRSEAGALQNTAQQLGSSLGTAFIGAVVITTLGSAFLDNVNDDPRVSDEVSETAGIAVGGGITFITAEELETAAVAAEVDESEIPAILEDYEDAQIRSLKLGLLVAMGLALVALPLAGGLPARRLSEQQPAEPAEPGPSLEPAPATFAGSSPPPSSAS
jgi:hypothetical protein